MCWWTYLLLGVYYRISLPLRWWFFRKAVRSGRVPAIILFYHRVADDCATPWTISNRMFRRQVQGLCRRVELVSLNELQRQLSERNNRRLLCAITFDDGYAENCQQAIPLLLERRIPFTYFVTVGNILSGKPFEHDLKCGLSPRPNSLEEIRWMAAAGAQIGPHGWNHVDLGSLRCSKALHREVVASKEALASLVGQPIDYFAFPYGYPRNIPPEAIRLAKSAGYRGICSAYGGYNFPGDDPFHLKRYHGDHSFLLYRHRLRPDWLKLCRSNRSSVEETKELAGLVGECARTNALISIPATEALASRPATEAFAATTVLDKEFSDPETAEAAAATPQKGNINAACDSLVLEETAPSLAGFASRG